MDEANRIRGALIPAYRKGFRTIFLIGAGLAALGFVLAWVLIPQVELSRPDDAALKEQGKKDYKKKGGNEETPAEKC